MLALDLAGGKLTKSQYSHKNGWAQLRAKQLSDAFGEKVHVLHNNEQWGDYETVFLYHGMEFKGALNLFGGASEDNAKFFERILTQKTNLISLDIPMPDYGALCKSRKKSDDYWAAIDWDAISKICNNSEYLFHPEDTDSLVIGDSHSFSAFQPGYMTIRHDGRTLAGVLKKSIRKEIVDNHVDPSTLKNITLYYGNIDIRHHLMRTEYPFLEIERLLNEYEKQIKDLNIPNVELVQVLPIEDISRKLPKTGYYEKTPFYGSYFERSALVQKFNILLAEICEKNNWKLFTWPQEWYIMDPLEYMQTYMERPKSVHCAPKFHRYEYWPDNTPSILTF